MRVMNIHAHFDDFEFTASGTFELWRRRLGPAFQPKVVVCTDGAGGHHRLSRRDTARVRLREQQESARLGNYEFELLRYPDGTVPREGTLAADTRLLASLWKTIRDFEPDYVFAPPFPMDPKAGVHVDHMVIADALRKVAYLINVPHAFSPEFPSRTREPKSCHTPVFLTVYDGYMSGANSFDVAVDVEPAFDQICKLTFCHQSQIMEWLPWVGRHEMEPPRDFAHWKRMMRERLGNRNHELGLRTKPLVEVFSVTRWGTIPDAAKLLDDFPNLIRRHSRYGSRRECA